MAEAIKRFTEMADDELLALLMRGDLPPSEKARIVLAVRERRVAERQTRFVIILTIVVTLATVVQAAGVIHSALVSEKNPQSCSCRFDFNAARGQSQKSPSPRQPQPKPTGQGSPHNKQ